MVNFVHLHTHSEYSILDGMSRVEEIIDKAVEYGQKAVAITDHGHMGNVPEFYVYAKEKGIKPIIGQEFYIVENASEKDKEERRHHIILLARNEQGYNTLCRLSTIASENFYYKPRIDGEILRKHSKEFDNIIALSGCMNSPISQAILKGTVKQQRDLIQFFNVVFPHFYLEFQKHGYRKPKDQTEYLFTQDEIKINKALWDYHKQYKIPVVVTNDSHYIDEDDQDDHEILLAIQTGAKLNDDKRFKFNGYGYSFCDASEIKKKFPQYIWRGSEKSMKQIVDMVDISLPRFETKEHFIPSFGIKDPDKQLKILCLKGLQERVPSKKQKRYLKELNYQLGVIKDCGYADEFLIVHDYVNYARQTGIAVGSGRGSMVGVLVSYLMGITEIDPIRFNLSFERALNPERPSLPDFDIDFSDKDSIIKYLQNRYGYENTIQIGAYSRMHYRSLLKALLRVFSYPYQQSNVYSKQLPDIVDIIAEKAPSDFDELVEQTEGSLRQLFDTDKQLVRLMKRFNGLIRGMSTHAGGLLIGDNSFAIRDFIPTYKVSQEKDLISQFDKKVVEKQLGFVKFDILGITTLEIIQNCLGLIGENIFERHPDGDLLEDQKTFDLINSGNLTYIFQLDGAANRTAITSVGGIHEFEDIVMVTSVARPGTSQFIPDLARNRKYKVEDYRHKDLAKIFAKTYGVLLYQEQVMEIARKFAGFNMIEIDDIKEMIKGKDHEQFEAMKPKFLKGCKKNGYTDEISLLVWETIEKGSGYLFNRSHAVSYSLISYQTAYLKSHYPLEFYISCMNISKANQDKIVSLVQESTALGIKILGPDIHKSDVHACIEGDSVRLGFASVKGIGETTATNIVAARNKDGIEGIRKLPRRVMSSRTIKALKEIGAFGQQHATSEAEIELLGFMLNDPVNKHISFINKHSRESDNDVVFGGVVTQVRLLKTKRGDDMAFVDMNVLGNKKSLAVFSEQLYKWNEAFRNGNILLVRADKQQNYDSVVPTKVKVLK